MSYSSMIYCGIILMWVFIYYGRGIGVFKLKKNFYCHEFSFEEEGGGGKNNAERKLDKRGVLEGQEIMGTVTVTLMIRSN